MNQSSMIGPKARPIRSVPKRCVVNSTIRISTAIGMTNGLRVARRDVHPFESAEHRDRRRDDAVPVDQRRPEQSHAGEQRESARESVRSDQRHQRQDAALAAVVRAHHEQAVFDRYGDDQRPHDERQNAERAGRREFAADGLHDRLQRVERARAEVAEHHAERRKHRPARGSRGCIGRRRRALCGGRIGAHEFTYETRGAPASYIGRPDAAQHNCRPRAAVSGDFCSRRRRARRHRLTRRPALRGRQLLRGPSRNDAVGSRRRGPCV